jgi:hypothetical protein
VHEPNSAIPTPEPDQAKIWPYMDLSKLVSLLDKRSLFFPQLHYLAAAGDSHEGSYSFGTYALIASRSEELESHASGLSGDLLDAIDEAANNARRWLYVNCWHESEYESAAMWKLYLHSAEGIAIQSTIGRLKESLTEAPAIQMIGRVKYIDFHAETFPLTNVFYVALHKRKSFEHEKELRAIVLSRSPQDDYRIIDDVGVYVPCQVERLIENVYVAPTMPLWFGDVVASIILRYGLSHTVHQSRLDTLPARATSVAQSRPPDLK